MADSVMTRNRKTFGMEQPVVINFFKNEVKPAYNHFKHSMVSKRSATEGHFNGVNILKDVKLQYLYKFSRGSM